MTTYAPIIETATAPDGVPIRYEVAGEGKPPIVFVHGWCCDRSYWAAQMRAFSASHRVVALDLGGHGESGMARQDWTMQAFGADVAAVLAALNLECAVLVGHSMGGPVIVEAARAAPERVAALVAVDYFNNVGRPLDETAHADQLARLRADFRGEAIKWVRTFFPGHADETFVERIAKAMAAAPSAVGISALDNLRRYNDAAAFKETQIPMRLINSDLWPTDLAAARRAKPDVQLAVLTRASHFLQMEDPDEFNRLLARAVREMCGS